MSVSRRELLRNSATGLLIAFVVPRKGRAEAAASAAAPGKPLPKPNAFVRIAPDDSVTVLLAHSEMGQGIWTGLAMMIAEELDCDWSKVHCEHAPAAPIYAHTLFGIQMTGGSSTTYSEFERYRTVGAMAREMLVRAAAEHWKTSPKHLRVEDGFIYNGKHKLSFGQVALAAEHLKPPVAVKLKDPKDFKLLGKPMRRIDSPEKINGTAQFGMDIQFPGLRTAMVARSPTFGGTVKSFDATAAKAVPGVEQVVQVPTGVAVIGKHYWAAKVGRDALKIEWDAGPGGTVDTTQMEASYRALAKTKGLPAKEAGDANAALASAKTRVEAEYYVPYLAHAPMEPLNCSVKLSDGGCEIWTGTQFQTGDQGSAAKAAGVPVEKVLIHTPFLGGGFGRRANPRSDFVIEAVQVAKAAGVPVKTVWSREDDIRGGFYRPAFLHRVEAAVDDKGAIAAWKHTIVGQSIMAGTPFEAVMTKNGIDSASVEGVVDNPYLEEVPARQISLHSPKSAVPVLWWRSVGNTHTAFAMESMIDELAHAAGQEPLAFRTALLKDKPRHLKVLKTAADKAGWGTPVPAGRARGLAVHESFESIVAQVAEVSVVDGEVRVHKMTCAIDCGFAVNPLGVEAQMQGAIAYALSAILHSEVTLKEGQVQQSNFHDYQVLRMHEMPEVSVTIVPSAGKMGGAGEPGTPPVFPAVANAVFASTGKRLRSLPLRFA